MILLNKSDNWLLRFIYSKLLISSSEETMVIVDMPLPRHKQRVRKSLKTTSRSKFLRLVCAGITLLTVLSILSTLTIQVTIDGESVSGYLFDSESDPEKDGVVQLEEETGKNIPYILMDSGGAADCPDGTGVFSIDRCVEAGSLLDQSFTGEKPFVKGEWSHTPHGCFTNKGQLHFNEVSTGEVDTTTEFWKDYALICHIDEEDSEDEED